MIWPDLALYLDIIPLEGKDYHVPKACSVLRSEAYMEGEGTKNWIADTSGFVPVPDLSFCSCTEVR